MTIDAWIGCILVSVFLTGILTFVGWILKDESGAIICFVAGLAISMILIFGVRWYYQNTAEGARELKTQESNFNDGIERSVRVYDATGNKIEEYDGKFDIEYDDDRILFDDENGARHIIYYPTGTVLIDEVTK